MTLPCYQRKGYGQFLIDFSKWLIYSFGDFTLNLLTMRQLFLV